MPRTQKAISVESGSSEIAEMGTLDPQAAADTAIMHEFFVNRDRVMGKLFGRTLRRSPVRDELVRQIVLQFAQNKRRRVAYYTKVCSFLASGPSVRTELDLLSDLGLVRFLSEPADRRTTQVAPTKKLVAFYNEQMPRLRLQVLEIAKRAE